MKTQLCPQAVPTSGNGSGEGKNLLYYKSSIYLKVNTTLLLSFSKVTGGSVCGNTEPGCSAKEVLHTEVHLYTDCSFPKQQSSPEFKKTSIFFLHPGHILLLFSFSGPSTESHEAFSN